MIGKLMHLERLRRQVSQSNSNFGKLPTLAFSVTYWKVSPKRSDKRASCWIGSGTFGSPKWVLSTWPILLWNN